MATLYKGCINEYPLAFDGFLITLFKLYHLVGFPKYSSAFVPLLYQFVAFF